MNAEVWAAVVLILGAVAEALRRTWKRADEKERKIEQDRKAADERRARAVRDRDAGGLFNGS